MGAARAGFSLAELLVALALLGVGMFALVSGALAAQKSFAAAAAEERGVRVAAAVIDSLVRVRAPVDGEATLAGVRVRWSMSATDELSEVRVEVEVPSGSGSRHAVYRAARARDEQ